MARFRTKRVYDRRSTEDGTRILIMRFWPRGVGKAQVDEWDRDVAPSRDLLFAFKRGGLPWEEYVRRYRAELRPETLAALRARRGVVTLLCSCKDETRCHRTVLLEDLLGAPRPPCEKGSSPSMEPRISRVILGVRDLSVSRKFYGDGLGWPISSASSEETVFLRCRRGSLSTRVAGAGCGGQRSGFRFQGIRPCPPGADP